MRWHVELKHGRNRTVDSDNAGIVSGDTPSKPGSVLMFWNGDPEKIDNGETVLLVNMSEWRYVRRGKDPSSD